jgi:hypothetical protein
MAAIRRRLLLYPGGNPAISPRASQLSTLTARIGARQLQQPIIGRIQPFVGRRREVVVNSARPELHI